MKNRRERSFSLWPWFGVARLEGEILNDLQMHCLSWDFHHLSLLPIISVIMRDSNSQVHIDASSCNTPPRAASPSSSQGSWVLDPEEGGWDGWDGLGASLTPSVCTPLRQTGHQQQQSQLSPLPSSVWTPTLESSPLRSWARVPQSSSAARYPTATSPPRSPSSARSCSSNSSGKAASEGLVGLARDEILEEIEILEAPTTCPSVSPPSRVVRSRQKACSGEESVGYPEIVDLDILDVGALSSPPNKNAIGPAVVVAAGMSTAETIEAIAEAGQLRQALMDKSPSPSRVVIPHEAFSSTINGSSSTPSEDAYKKRSVDAPPAQASNRTALPPTSRSDLIPAATSITTTETTPRVRRSFVWMSSLVASQQGQGGVDVWP